MKQLCNSRSSQIDLVAKLICICRYFEYIPTLSNVVTWPESSSLTHTHNCKRERRERQTLLLVSVCVPKCQIIQHKEEITLYTFESTKNRIDCTKSLILIVDNFRIFILCNVLKQYQVYVKLEERKRAFGEEKIAWSEILVALTEVRKLNATTKSRQFDESRIWSPKKGSIESVRVTTAKLLLVYHLKAN